MSGGHKNPTISFRITPIERKELEAKIIASGLLKKDYFIRSCLNNHVCVVGSEKHVYKMVEELNEMQIEYLAMINAIIWTLNGAKYLWECR